MKRVRGDTFRLISGIASLVIVPAASALCGLRWLDESTWAGVTAAGLASLAFALRPREQRSIASKTTNDARWTRLPSQQALH